MQNLEIGQKIIYTAPCSKTKLFGEIVEIRVKKDEIEIIVRTKKNGEILTSVKNISSVFNYTLGPWEINYKEHKSYSDGFASFIISKSKFSDIGIARILSLNKSDASLISATPDFYEAAKKIQSYFKDLTISDEFKPYLIELNNAIDKAEGDKL